MALNNDISSFIIPAEQASLYNLKYYSVDGGSTGCNININGVNVQMGSGSTIDIMVNTVSGGTGCYLYGDNPDVFGGVNTPIYELIVDNFNTRVLSDGGTIEAEDCLITFLNELNG